MRNLGKDVKATNLDSRFSADDGIGDGRTDVENDNPNHVYHDGELRRMSKPKLKDRRSLMKRQGSSRRRRRSSARFLKMTPDEGEQIEYENRSSTNFGEVYRNAIRMNAENRINASNSWSLNLIDHLDRFISPELRDANTTGRDNSTREVVSGGFASKVQRHDVDDNLGLGTSSGVNFTKASCTLDASVKIYSYRVDDVHLTSYKVLANLNRNDNSSTTQVEDKSSAIGRGKSKSSDSVSTCDAILVGTVEQNPANLNLQKLDAAFDVDPLFHKMSKTFDEGGAKGLLLANLGVGTTGCNIIFDSSLDNDESNDTRTSSVEEAGERGETFPFVDVTKLFVLLQREMNSKATDENFENTPLVPQLASLRIEFEDLGKGGFVEEKAVSSGRYASSSEEEAEADKSILHEAFERSRASMGDLGQCLNTNVSACSDDSDHSEGYESIFNCNGHDMFDDLVGEHRFSSHSFERARASISTPNNERQQIAISDKNDPTKTSDVSNLLDAIASGCVLMTQTENPYEFFSAQELERFSKGNLWAGAQHWKKTSSRSCLQMKSKSDAKNNDANPSARFRQKERGQLSTDSSQLFVSVSKPSWHFDTAVPNLNCLKDERGLNSFQFTKGTYMKYSKLNNLLPVDAGLGIKNLLSPFSRPHPYADDTCKTNQPVLGKFDRIQGISGNKTSFEDEPIFGACAFDEETSVSDNMTNVSPTLSNVRKVDKIKIGYATVARRVDVKRLKRDLWRELEQTFARHLNKETCDNSSTAVDESTSQVDELDHPNSLSFQETVHEMQVKESQADVTLPFYFLCILHLCNEKELSLESSGLSNFLIHSS